MPYEKDVNAMLYRQVQPGKMFENLIPVPKGEKTFIGSGDTSFSIKKMAEMVKQYSGQMKQVAEALQADSLDETLANIKDFIFNHFQYKADADDQLLRSPGYAWHYDRFNGIDCKSYSILASSLLTELGILHYIRRIKQPGYFPTEFTHVYVVVPEDQKNGNLKQGYYVIDGTLADDFEPPFVEKDDLFMKHYALNAPGMGFSLGKFNLKDLLSLKNLFSGLDCFGGSSYSGDDFKNKVVPNIETYFNNLVTRINNAVASSNDQAFAEAINEFYGNSKMLVAAQEKNLTKGWNSCTSSVIKANIKVFKFYRDTVGSALTAWLNENFTKDALLSNNVVQWSNTGAETKYGFRHLNFTPAIVISEPLAYYTPKPKAITKFELTPYVGENFDTPAKFNPLQFIQGLSTVLASFDTQGNQTTIPGNGQNNTIGGNNGAPQPKTAGSGVIGLVIGIAALGLLIKGFASTPSKPSATNATHRKSTPKNKRNVSTK